MKKVIIKFQTSELIPAPFAYAVFLELTADKSLQYNIDLEYLDRDSLTDDEILDEGFTLNDNITFNGGLPVQWLQKFNELLSKTNLIQKDTIEENEDLWIVETDNQTLYPKNTKLWSEFLEQIRQAILEDQNQEKQLTIDFVHKENGKENKSMVNASFKNLSITLTKNGKQESLPWSQLMSVLRNVYSGEMDYSKATHQIKGENGMFINFGDDYWFEVGKSYFIKPSKLKMFL